MMYRLLLTIALITVTVTLLPGQCVVSNLIGAATQGQDKLGQSFTMTAPPCVNGFFTEIGILSLTNNTGVTLKIYQGAGFNEPAQYTQTGINFTLVDPLTNFIALQGGAGSLAFEAGNVYTFSLELTAGGSFQLLGSTNMNVYSGGQFYNKNGNGQQNQDLVFTVRTAVSPLPVELVYFSVREADGKVRLAWETASELNNKGFEIQHSTRGKSWTAVGFVEGAGTSLQSRQYHFVHPAPLPGINYYRLRQVDYDGVYEFSAIEAIDMPTHDFAPELYPNPANRGEAIYLSNDLECDECLVELLDLKGRLVYRQRSPGRSMNIPVEVKPGIYILRISHQNGTASRKVVIR